MMILSGKWYKDGSGRYVLPQESENAVVRSQSAARLYHVYQMLVKLE
ncbi:MAG: hypothetical protein IKJ45_11750 [Kiritimatiellae bacterium]|nr:hypothetical protein [Akkermansia sp.]MBR3923780.1 hypothetical protein [Kiritimatiellia bacterium]